jgi:hypothetical protein
MTGSITAVIGTVVEKSFVEICSKISENSLVRRENNESCRPPPRVRFVLLEDRKSENYSYFPDKSGTRRGGNMQMELNKKLWKKR